MSDITLEGKITRAGSVLPHTSQAGKETTKQFITMDVKGILTKITCYGMDDMTPYIDKIIRMNNLKQIGTGYMAGYKTEIDDRTDSDVGEEDYAIPKLGTGLKSPPKMGELVDNITPRPIPSELSKFTIEVKRSKDYQTIGLSEEFTGSFAEIESYWEELNKKALALLLRMPKL